MHSTLMQAKTRFFKNSQVDITIVVKCKKSVRKFLKYFINSVCYNVQYFLYNATTLETLSCQPLLYSLNITLKCYFNSCKQIRNT